MEDRVRNELIPIEQVKSRMKTAFRLENTLKNIVIRRLIDIKTQKSMSSIKESVAKIIHQQKEDQQVSRTKLRRKILMDHEDLMIQQWSALEDDDNLYNRSLVLIARLQKMLTSQSMALDSIEKNLNFITLSSASTLKTIASMTPQELRKDIITIDSFDQSRTVQVDQFMNVDLETA